MVSLCQITSNIYNDLSKEWNSRIQDPFTCAKILVTLEKGPKYNFVDHLHCTWYTSQQCYMSFSQCMCGMQEQLSETLKFVDPREVEDLRWTTLSEPCKLHQKQCRTLCTFSQEFSVRHNLTHYLPWAWIAMIPKRPSHNTVHRAGTSQCAGEASDRQRNDLGQNT